MDVRTELERLTAERGVDYVSLSRLIGRNDAYIQQFIKRGTPKRLAERDRHILAQFFGIDEQRLGAPPVASRHIADSRISVPRLDVGASAGHGALPQGEAALSHFAFDRAWLRALGIGDASGLSVIEVTGDSMAPTLADGDEILVNRADGAERLRDGIYVLRADDNLLVKRLSPNPAARTVSIRSDNPAYPDWPECPVGDITIVGRVVWAGRRFG